MHGQMQPAWEFEGSTCSLHFCPFQTHSYYFIYIESLIIYRIFRTIMEPDEYFAAMKCKGANGISLYPFWSSNYNWPYTTQVEWDRAVKGGWRWASLTSKRVGIVSG
jgi:hypothetical protein